MHEYLVYLPGQAEICRAYVKADNAEDAAKKYAAKNDLSNKSLCVVYAKHIQTVHVTRQYTSEVIM